MELDLDSFLTSRGGGISSVSSDEEDESTSVHRRTVDEILNDSDSDSSSPDSPPAISRSLPKEATAIPKEESKGEADACGLEAVSETLEEPSSSFNWRRRTREITSSSYLSSLGIRSYSNASRAPSSSRQLLPLFGNVMPNPKPGAALAAAAAASRSIPTPHAAAIKSRRASSASAEKVLPTQETTEDRPMEANSVSDSFTVSDLSFVVSASNRLGGIGDAREVDASEFSLPSPSSSSLGMYVSHEVLHGEQASTEGNQSILVIGKETSEKRTEVRFCSVDVLVSSLKQDLENLPSSSSISAEIDENVLKRNEMLPIVDEPVTDADYMLDDEEEHEITATEVDDLDGKVFSDGKNSTNGEESRISIEMDSIVKERAGEIGSGENQEKKSRASMKPLEWAEELEKRQASSGLDWEEGAASQPMRLEGIHRGPPAVGYLQMDLDNMITCTVSSQTFKHDYGSPQVITVHINFIAIGTSKGTTLVFPSKYSPHHADKMDDKMLVFGSSGEKTQVSATSMSFNQQGDLLLVGYSDGHLTIWDVQRGTAAKIITGEHNAPVTHTVFLGQDSQVSRQFKAVTGDSKGLILLHSSTVLLLNHFSIKTQCLLDGQKTGTVLCACPIVMDNTQDAGSSSAQGHPSTSVVLGRKVGGVVGGETGWKLFNGNPSIVEEGVVLFATHQNALVVRLSPTVEVYQQLTRPDAVREGSLPYAAWKCMVYSADCFPDASDKVSWLALAWDRKIQVARLVKSKMIKYKEWVLDGTAIGVEWLDDQMFVVLTIRGQLFLFSRDGEELHRTNFTVDGYAMDDFIMYHTHYVNSYGNPEKAYHNAVAVRGATVYILGPMHLIISRLLPWKERIQVLQKAGDWMGALDMALRLYDGHAHGVIDLPRTIDTIRDAIMPYLVELILLYVDEVFSYITIAFSNQRDKVGTVEDPKITDVSLHSEIEEQYARVGGVAVEFCVHIKRTDILFDGIFSKFVSVHHGGTFLEILEPYILRDMLGCLPPEIMQALVEHYSRKGLLERVEQCVLHMDISSLDFNQVVRLCREHGLYGALIYLFNRGLDDFKSPLEELLLVVQNTSTMDAAAIGRSNRKKQIDSQQRTENGKEKNTRFDVETILEKSMYRLLVYLKYSFQGLAFPPGHGFLLPSRLHSVRKELLKYLLEDSKLLTSEVSKRLKSSRGYFPNVCYMLCLATEATLDVFKCAFAEIEPRNDPSADVAASVVADVQELEDSGIQEEMVQSTINALISILDLESDLVRSFQMDDTGAWPSEQDICYMLDFIAYLVASKGATVSETVLKHILEYLTSLGNLHPTDSDEKYEASLKEKQVLSILKVVPHEMWNSSVILLLCMEAQFYQACGLIHYIRSEYVSALDSYMKDLDEPIHAFSFINKMLSELDKAESVSFHSAVISRIPELVQLSRECTFFLVIDHFGSESENIMSQLHSHPQSLFLFLKTLIDVQMSGTLIFPEAAHTSNSSYNRIRDSPNELAGYLEKLSNFPKLLHQNTIQVTDEVGELYLELLCQYERNSVLKFLETYDNYRLEHCLRLCQQYGITDAAAFLLERVGDVGSALELLMSGLDDKINLLVSVVESKFSALNIRNSSEMEQLTDILKLNEAVAVCDVLHASVGLCQRNTQRLDRRESESLWFRLFDFFSEPLKRFCSGKGFPERKNNVGHMTASSNASVYMDEIPSTWKFLKSSAHILRRLFSQLIGEIIEGMTGYLPLPAVMAKLLSDNGNQEFGDFKFTILKMLGTYNYERRILDTAKSLIEDDTYYTMGLLKKGASHAFAPQNFICCICGLPLTKGSSSGVRLFSCGHATHLHCETEEIDLLSTNSATGCPVCLHKKNLRTKGKSSVIENGLVNSSLSTSWHTLQSSSIQHSHEIDAIDKSYGLQQMSRVLNFVSY
ncbi:hypothetical protein AXF42_Ash009665 [Apostasia shenzhenica]|uniref:RING-type domain-containing protein n=1 Tax=Apostasia shenzhenica TaxID=1088818 RepID=A0A2I0AWR9_9ASPA|nr:hypothetical protein AXF42_Ash009665 [Apostasia shenzhenica]